MDENSSAEAGDSNHRAHTEQRMLLIMLRIRQLTEDQLIEYVVDGCIKTKVAAHPRLKDLYEKLNIRLRQKETAYQKFKRERMEKSCLHVEPPRKRMLVGATVQGMHS